MEMQDGQMQFEQQEYQMAYSSPQINFLNDILLATNDQQFIDIIAKLKNDSDNFTSLFSQLKEYSAKNKDSPSLKALYQRIIKLVSNIKVDGQYFPSQRQKNIIWIFQKLCCNDKIFNSTSKAQQSLLQIFKDFTFFEDFCTVIKLVKNFNNKSKNSSNFINNLLNNLFYEKFQKMNESDMKFVQTMKNLDQQRKLIIKTQILHYFLSDLSKYKIQQNQANKIVSILNNKPYQKLFQILLEKRLKPAKQLKTSLLKAKMQIADDKLQLVFGSKCQLNKELKTKQNFQLAAKKSDGIELLPQIDSDSLVTHGDYLYTKWSSDVLIAAKQKVGYDDTEDHLNDGFLKILSFLKKIFQHRHKHIRTLQNHNKILEQISHEHIPEETLSYFCHAFQLFVKYLSVNSLEINHRSHNLSQIITVTFFDEILLFFEDQLKKNNKPILTQTIDFLITFTAHLFYRRDFQAITPITSKTSQTIIKILLAVQNFPTKWSVLRNYKLVVDRWGQTVEQGSQDMKNLAHKFLKAYFNQKVIIHSKSNSTVFNPIFITRPYCKIFGSEFLKFVQTFQKSLEQLQTKSRTVTSSRQMDQVMSKIILFMSARVRFQDSNKIAQHLNSIYKRYAHIIPQIYLFRSWIMQVNFSKVIPSETSLKIIQASSSFNKFNQIVKQISEDRLIKPFVQKQLQQQNDLRRIIIDYQMIHYKVLNSIELKTKNQEYTEQIIIPLWELVLNHIRLYYLINQKVKLIENSKKEQYQKLKQQAQLLRNTKYASVFSIVQKLKNNFISAIRYLICNADKLLLAKDCSILIRVIGQWIRNQVNQADKDHHKFYYCLKQFIKITGQTVPTDLNSHLSKNQILGAMRSVSGGTQLGLNKNNQVPLNQVSSLYEKIKPVFTKLIKLIVSSQQKVKSQDKQQKNKDNIFKQFLQYLIFPITNIAGPCYFNGKIEEKSTQNMVLGVFWQQSEAIFKDFSINQLLSLHEKYPLNNMLQITKNKLGKIIEIKNNRNNGANIFQGRPNRNVNEAMQQLRLVNIPQEYIQIAMQNIEIPDAQVALQWIQNNQDRIDGLIFQKAMKQSKQQTIMKPTVQIKSQSGKITQINYNQFVDNLQKSLKGLVKSLAKQLFSQNGKKITKILFVILQAFKEDFKKKQYQNFAKKMFQQINNLNGKQKFDDKSYRLILQILNYTMKKQQNLYKQYYKDGLFLKIMSFVGYFGNSKTDKAQKQIQKNQDFKNLLQILNQTLPQFKQPTKELSTPLLNYLSSVLDVVELSGKSIDQKWQILYKLSLLQNQQLRQKIIKLYSQIITSKQIFQNQQKNKKQKSSNNDKKNSIFNDTNGAKTYLLPLAKILLQQNKKFLQSNIQIQIKGYIIQTFKDEINQMKSKNQNKLLQIDTKRFQMSFQKFVNNKQFEQVFKKLFSKKKSKKNLIFYDIDKHPLFQNEISSDNQQNKGFISLKYDPQVEQILQAFLRRVVQSSSLGRQSQQQALIDLYKLLDYFKILIPTLLRKQWQEGQDKRMNILKWLLTKSIALNKKKYQFMTFLAMNNHFFIDHQKSISDYVCNEYLNIIKNGIQQFISNNQQQKSNESINLQTQKHSQKFTDILINFVYLLQINKFNQQCFLKVNNQLSVLQLLQETILSVNLTNLPIIYVLLSQSIFILKKRQMVQRLKQKYSIVQNFSPDAPGSISTNLCSHQFLNMGLIYKVDPANLSDSSAAKRKRNIFNGSNGRIIVDQVNDEDDGFNQLQDLDQMGDNYDSITNLLRMRLRHRDSRNADRIQGADQTQLLPNQVILNSIEQANQVPLNNNGNQPNNAQQINQNKSQQINETIQQNKIEQQITDKHQNITIDYDKIVEEKNNQLIENLKLISSLLPQNTFLLIESKTAVQKENNRIISEQEERQNIKKSVQNNQINQNNKVNGFNTKLSLLIKQNSSITTNILPDTVRFGTSNDQKPDFYSKLSLNDGIKKLSKFQKRFKFLILMSISHKINPRMWENQYTQQNNIRAEIEGGQVGSARWLMSRLGSQAMGGQNRDQMIYHIQRLINQQRGQESNLQQNRQRNLNLNQAIQDLPQQPEKPVVAQEKPKVQQKKPQQKIQVQQNKQKNEHPIQEMQVQEKMVEQKGQQKKQQQVKQNQQLQMPNEFQIEQEKTQNVGQTEKKQQKMQIQQQKEKQQKTQQKPLIQNVQAPKIQQKKQQIVEQKPSQLVNNPVQIEQEALIHNIQQQISQINQEPLIIPPTGNVINQPQDFGPYRQILAMFGLPQSFLVDNGIDAQSFDCLPEEFQIDQITHYMNQAQNRAINQSNNQNQANIPNQGNQQNQEANNNPPADSNNSQQPPAQQNSNNVNDVLQQNIALFASMDPQTRAEMLADYPPQFLLQLPVQMRTQVEQFRQRQLRRIVQQEQNQASDWRQQINYSQKQKKKVVKNKANLKYPNPKQINFNTVTQSVAKKLSECLFLKIPKFKTLEGFRLLLENYPTQQKAIATVIAVLNLEQGVRMTQLEFKSQQNNKGFMKYEILSSNNPQDLKTLKENLLSLVYEAINSQLYKNQDFLKNKISTQNYLDIKIEIEKQLDADQKGFWPLYQLLPHSIDHYPRLAVQILKRLKQLPLKLIKFLVDSIRADKLTSQIYKNLQFLSKNEDMKKLFIEQFTQQKPPKLQVFGKIIKYQFAKLPYLRKMHQEALNFYSADYNEFLNQIFGIYSPQDIKQLQSLLAKHKHVHFEVIKYLYSQNRVLDKQPMGLILKMPHLLDFETKKYLFRKHPKIRRGSRYRLPIEVNRSNILQQSFNQIMSKTPKQLEGRLQITFMDQQGYDAGGLTRQWLLCLSREIFRPDYALFQPSSSGNTYQPNPKSFVNPDHLQYFKFIGRFVGKALAQNQLVDAYFTRAFYKMILGQQVQLSDLQQQDYAFYRSMLWLKQNPVEQGDYTFSYLYDNFGQRIVKDLITNGRNVNVNQQNKLEYIQKYCLAKMRDDFKVQVQKFLQGFHEIVPHECISFFEAKQLELLISGLPEIDFEDLRNNVDYSGFAPTDQAIKWFWQIIQEFSQQDLARLIQFITGTSKIPVDGFANIKGMNGPQRISIHKDPNNHQLPKAHTCFNQLDLPNYESKQLMRQRIVTAITWGSQGFGFM